MSCRPWFRSSLLAALILARSGAAYAQADDANAQARDLFQRGVEAASRHDYAQAVVQFQAAQALRSAPSIRFNLASALYELQRHPEAFEALDGIDVAAQPAALRARIDALAQSLRAHIALLSVQGVRDGHTVRLDGAEQPALLRGQSFAVVPGAHRIEVMDGERTLLARAIELRAGVQFELDVAETAPPGPAGGEVPPDRMPVVATEPLPAPAPPQQAAPADSSRRWLYVELGVVSLLLAGVAVAVPLAMKRHRDRDDEPPPSSGFAPGVLSW